MPWGDAPATDEADAVRVLVGDTNASSPLLPDGAYTLIIATEKNLYFRGALAANMLAGKYATDINKRVGDLWHDAKSRGTHFLNLSRRLRLEGQRRAPVTPFLGGYTSADKDARAEDTSIEQPQFTVGMSDSVESDSDIVSEE